MPTNATLRVKQRDVWTGSGSFATTLLCLLGDTYGVEALSWHPETLQIQIAEDFGVELPPASFSRLMFAIALQTTDDFYWSLPDFIDTCNVLSGDIYDPTQWDPADVAEIAWGIVEAALINPPQNEEPFSPEIVGYIAAALDREGIVNPPDVLRMILREDAVKRVQNEFSDDPVMYNAIYDFETAKAEEVNQIVCGRLRTLSDQLKSLPLEHGSADGVAESVLKSLRPAQADSPLAL